MALDKPAAADHDIHDLIARRWSPRAFADRAVSPEQMASLFEAARWAASSGNEQPWSFVYAHREDAEAFERIAESLRPNNQTWARRAAVLVATVAKLDFVHPTKPDRPNPHAFHDVGLATAQLTLQATALGLAVHPMAGFDGDALRVAVGIPAGHEPVAVLAIGYAGDPGELPDKLRERETAPRSRRPQSAFVFRGTWAAD